MISDPKITIILSFKNGGKHLRTAVDSILIQNFQDWELLLFDDGSEDKSHLSIQNLNDNRIRFFRFEKSEGLAVRLNQGIKLARGKYIARMDHDDVCFFNRLSVQFEFLEANKEVDLVSSNCLLIDEDSNKLGSLYIDNSISYKGTGITETFPFPHPTWMGKTTWFKLYNYKEKPSPYRCEDQELLFRAYKETNIMRLNTTLLAYRICNRNILINIRTYFAIFCFQLPALLKVKLYSKILLSIAVFILRIINLIFILLHIIKAGRPYNEPSGDTKLHWSKTIIILKDTRLEE